MESREVRSEDDCAIRAARIQQGWGFLDVLVNNAGILREAPVEEATLRCGRTSCPST
ncbi:MAG: hypothetical protein ACRDTJ_29865 [Pseudonocardiaceae bacterium]